MKLRPSSPATIAPPFLGRSGCCWARCWMATPVTPRSRARSVNGTRHLVVGALLGYADAIVAGRGGRELAEATFAVADAQMGPLVAWYRALRPGG